MTDIQKFVVKDDGEEYEFYIEPGELAAIPNSKFDDGLNLELLPQEGMRVAMRQAF